MKYLVKEVFYQKDHIHPEEVVETIEYSDFLEAYKCFRNLENAILIEKDPKKEIVIAKNSRSFSIGQIKQFYLDEACDILGLQHYLYKQLQIDELQDQQINKLIVSILNDESDTRAGNVHGPVLNELLNLLIERRI